MKYVKVTTILPDSLVKEIQKYIQGGYIYIPSQPQTRKKWGENSGNHEYLKSRNEEIYNKFKSGNKISNLAQEFFLSDSSIKKIIYSKAK
jgi:Mor family transcriptional regulator